MNLDDLKVGELKALMALTARPAKKRKSITDGKPRIVILQRGWVVVGKYYQDGDDCRLENGAVIRIWGTTKGITELVNGPIANKTILDKSEYPIRFHELTIVAMLDVNEAAWAEHL